MPHLEKHILYCLPWLRSSFDFDGLAPCQKHKHEQNAAYVIGGFVYRSKRIRRGTEFDRQDIFGFSESVKYSVECWSCLWEGQSSAPGCKLAGGWGHEWVVRGASGDPAGGGGFTSAEKRAKLPSPKG